MVTSKPMAVPTNASAPEAVPPADSGDRISYITVGPFSGVVDSLLPRISTRFPECVADTFDVTAWLREDRKALLEGAARVLSQSGPRAFTGRQRFVRALWHSSFLDGRVGREAAARAGVTPDRLVFSLQTQSLFDAGIAGVPHFIYTDHTAKANSYYPDFEPGDLDPARVERERRIYRNARLVFTMSNHVSRSLQEHYGMPPERIRCVGAGSNIAAVPRRPGAEESGRVLFVGRDWGRKGGPQLLAAMSEVRERHPEAVLVVAGCDPGVVPSWVEVVGDVPFDRVAELFAGAATFSLPTRREPFGLVFVEALSCAVPVVASDIGALPDIVQDGETGFLVDPDDIHGLAAALGAILDDPERGRRFGALGAERMRARYTWDHVADSIAGHIRGALT